MCTNAYTQEELRNKLNSSASLFPDVEMLKRKDEEVAVKEADRRPSKTVILAYFVQVAISPVQ